MNASLTPTFDTQVGPEPYETPGRGELLRWLAGGFIALGMHAAIVLAIASHSDDSALDSGASVVMMELAPISAAPPTAQRAGAWTATSRG